MFYVDELLVFQHLSLVGACNIQSLAHLRVLQIYVHFQLTFLISGNL